VLPVTDTTQAFQQLAVYYQQKVAPKLAAITGSNGKTTTKDMTESVLAQKFRTYKTQGNYNNDLGMPYTILHMPIDTEMLILEMGMDHAGEISFLSKLAKPDAAAITLIGEAHIEHLGSRAGIAAAKMEIVDGLKEDGLLIIPGDEPLLQPLFADLTQQLATFGLSEGTIRGEILNETKEETTNTVFQF
jgi:UDP-N-acetylmuramoyl-tripeptide--D-alanyl-D-alanine ligase